MRHSFLSISALSLWCVSCLTDFSLFQHAIAADHIVGRKPGRVTQHTPAERRLDEWLAAFNTGNLETMEAFTRGHFAPAALAERSPRQRAESDRWMYMNLGPMKVVRIDAASEWTTTATVYQELVEGWGHLTVKVAPEGPHGLLSREISFFDPPPAGLEAADRLSERGLDKVLDQFAGKLVEADVFSGVVLVAKQGRAIFERAYGMARKGPDVPNTVDTRFQLGSVSKMFTAVAIAQLVERGALSFKDPIAKVLPTYPDRASAQRITVSQLLTHSSGLPDYFQSPRYSDAQGTLVTPADYWPMFAGQPLRFEPGVKWEYSSSNYVVLGAIIEHVAQRPFREYIEDQVFRRAGMSATTYQEGVGPEPRAVGFARRLGPGGRPNLQSSTPVPVRPQQLVDCNH